MGGPNGKAISIANSPTFLLYVPCPKSFSFSLHTWVGQMERLYQLHLGNDQRLETLS